MSREPWTIIVNSDDGTPKDLSDFGASHYEMTDDVVAKVYEQMYGMIWWMAYKASKNSGLTPLAAINNARENAQTGVDIGTGAWVQAKYGSEEGEVMPEETPKRKPMNLDRRYGFHAEQLIKILGLEGTSVTKIEFESHGGFFYVTTTEEV
jgi:hypothetical protein